MMRAIFSGLVLAALSLPATAAPPRAVGAVALVDHVNNRVKVDGPGGREAWFKCSPRTAVTVSGERASVEDLRPGYRVAVAYDPLTGVAERIDAAP